MNKNNQNNNSSDVIDLGAIFFYVLSRAWIIVLALLVGLVVTYKYEGSKVRQLYTATASMYVKNPTANNNNSDEESDNTSTKIDVSYARTLASTYIAVMTEDVVMDEVGKKMQDKFDDSRLAGVFAFDTDSNGKRSIQTNSISGKISMDVVNKTELIKVEAVTTDPEISAALCDSVCEIAPEVLTRVVGVSAVEAVGKAKVPVTSTASFDIKKKCVKMSVVFAAMVTALILLQYLLDNTVQSGDVLAEKLGVPLLMEIPEFDSSKRNKKKRNLFTMLLGKIKKKKEVKSAERLTLIDMQDNFVVNEAYNSLRTNLFFSVAANDNNVIVFTSSIPGEGKTTTVANLALSIAKTESKVLVIDADMRKPRQHSIFKLNNKKGLSTVITGMSKLEETIHKNVYGNMDVITSGTIPPNPSQLLESEKTKQLIEQVKDMYDYVFIDTPPLSLVSDALILSKNAAGVVLASKQGITTYDQIKESVNSIEFVDATLLGCIVNEVDIGSKSYGRGYKYRYGYKYGYKYGYSYGDNDGKSE